MKICLAWPPQVLWPNRKAHWAKRAPVAKKYRHDAMLLTKVAGWSAEGSAHLRVEFCPPDRRRRDLDGMLSAIKPAIDGISDALGIDDQHFSIELDRGEVVKGGKVKVTLGSQ